MTYVCSYQTWPSQCMPLWVRNSSTRMMAVTSAPVVSAPLAASTASVRHRGFLVHKYMSRKKGDRHRQESRNLTPSTELMFREEPAILSPDLWGKIVYFRALFPKSIVLLIFVELGVVGSSRLPDEASSQWVGSVCTRLFTSFFYV